MDSKTIILMVCGILLLLMGMFIISRTNDYIMDNHAPDWTDSQLDTYNEITSSIFALYSLVGVVLIVIGASYVIHAPRSRHIKQEE